MIRDVRSQDAEAICSIYNYYIRDSVITFETEAVSIPEMQERIEAVTEELPWMVYEEEEIILGYAYASKWKDRFAYRYSVESTVYLSKGATGKGMGFQLYKALIDRLADLSYHSIMGGISLPNPASIALHEKMGFKKVAHLKEVGWKMDRWVDVGYWELIIPHAGPGDSPRN